MGYERYPRNSNPQGDYYNRSNTQDYGREYTASSARDYAAAGEYDRDYQRGRGNRGDQGYGREAERGYGAGGRGQEYDRDHDRGHSRDRGRDYMPVSSFGMPEFDQMGYALGGGFGGSGGYRDRGQSRQSYEGRGGRGGGYDRDRQSYGRSHSDDDRGFFERAGDEVRSWFGDEEAERRRERDMRQDQQYGSNRSSHDRDSDYHSWRRSQIEALDRDYDEYRNENRSKFENEFSSWRSERQTQRGSLGKVTEHMEVVGSDGGHVGTVDKVRGDRIILTKTDQDAGGHHHSIPSRWIESVDDKVTIRKTADEAHAHWRDEERNTAIGGDGTSQDRSNGPHTLNRSFSGTY